MMRHVRIAGCATLIVALASCGRGGDRAAPPAPTSRPAPGPIFDGGAPSGRDPLGAADRAAATAATRRFLAGYVPYLYGRARAATVAPVTPSVARTLRRSSARVTPAQATRHPRITDVRVTGQTAASALATAMIADGGPAPYQLTLTVERRGGRWQVSDLGDDH